MHFCGQTPDATVWLHSDTFKLKPDYLYSLSYSMKKDVSSIRLVFYIEYKSEKDAALSGHIVFAFREGKPDDAGWLHFGQDAQSFIIFPEPQAKGEPVKHRNWNGSAFSFPPEKFGDAPLVCRIKVSATGLV